jgi:hypothetical protein
MRPESGMSFNVFPLHAKSSGPPAAQPAAPGEVVDLGARRPEQAAVPAMPDQVWDELDLAAARWQSLRDEGREIRFEQPLDGGRIRATLRDVRSGAERALPLTELFGPRDDGPPAAA